MTRRGGVSARTQALAKAAQAVARRDAERIAREKAIKASLAEFYRAQDEIERIHAEAAKAALPLDAAMRDAVRALDRLGESRLGITELTGLSAAQVRGYLSSGDERHGAAAPVSCMVATASATQLTDGIG